MAADAAATRDASDQRRQGLVNWRELLPTAAGSAVATLVLSRLGVAGTIAGAAVTPVIITLTSAALSKEADRAHDRIARRSKPRWWRRLSQDPDRRHRLARALATAGAAIVIVAAGILIAESIAGKPVSDWGHHGGSGYTLGRHTPARATPTATPTPRPGNRRTPSSTPEARHSDGPAAPPSPTPSAPVPSPTASPGAPAPTPLPTTAPAASAPPA